MFLADRALILVSVVVIVRVVEGVAP